MKTTTIRMLGKGLTALCLMLLSFTGWSQTPAVTMTVSNMVQTGPSTFEYDVYLTSTGTSALALRAYSSGLNHTVGLGNGGTITHTYLSRDAALSTIPTPTAGYTAATNHLRMTTTTATAGNEVVLVTGVPVRCATMRVTTSGVWGNSVNPFTPLAPSTPMQVLTLAGRTQCVATCYVNYPATTNFSLFGTGNAPTATSLNVLTGVMNPSPTGAAPFLLNPILCTSDLLSTTTASACDTYTWTAGNGNTYTASGTYDQLVVDGTCVDTNRLVLTITPSTSNTTTATACDSYTWSVNSTTYSASGMYTSVNGCATEILDLTITPSTSNTTTVSACDTYTWSVNSTTYTASGTYTSVNGCHTEILNLTISSSSSNTTVASACDSYTWSVNSTTYTASGMYTVNTGCATETLDLTITASTSNTTTASACDMYTWSVNSTTYTASGTYTSVTGCHTEILNLTITPSTSNTTTVSACDMYTWSVNSTMYMASGTYTSVSGCHTEILNLTITPSTTNNTVASACDTYTWSVNSTTYTASGMYTSVNGCHTETLDLTITPSTSNTTTVSACDTYTWSVNSTTYTASGTYTSVTGCHTEILNLTINSSSSTTTTISACDSYTWNGTIYTVTGMYTVNTGCATETLDLTITPSTSNTTTASACDSYTWSVNSTTYNASGTYTSVSGCHTEILNLTITPSTSNTTTASACDSYTWSVNSTTYNASGTYTSVSGCHTEILNLTITPSTSNTTTAAACDSYTWSVNSTTYNASGTYTSVSGCHTEILNLTITPSTTNVTTAAACDSYTWSVNSVTYTASGTWSVTTGCHTETLNLTISNPVNTSSTVTATNSYMWACNMTTYTASGTYTCTTAGANGCVNTETLNLTINTVVACGTCAGFTLSVVEDQPISCNGNNDASLQATASPAGSYTYTIVSPTQPSSSNTNGYFDMLQPGTHTVYATDGTCTTCETIFFENPLPLDMTFTTDSMVSCLGNDGVLSINITGGTNVLQGYLTWWTNSLGDTLNDVLSNNFALSLSNLPAGNYNVAVEDDRGCFYNETGAIDVAPPIVVNGTYNPIVCIGGTTAINVTGTGGVSYPPAYASTLTYDINGAPVAAAYPAGTYTITATDYKGCTGSNVITIMDAAAITGSSSLTVCDSYTWACNSMTYTTSGSYTCVAMAANGCDSTHTLNLTVNYSTTDTLNATACDTYTWVTNGMTYTTSGQYTAMGTNSNNCPHTSVLNLTVNYSTTGTTTATACDAYTWTCNGMTYTATGMYTCTYLNAANCVHTETLDLTIGGNTSSTDNITACDSYTWPANGMTYTASGTWTATSLNASGCVHTSTLNLTVNYSTSSTTSYYWCDMYTWPVSGMTYTASGTYAHTSLNAAGCTYTQYLNLTLGATTVTIVCCVEACDSYTWAQNGVTYTASGSYYWIGQNASGCADVYTLCLTINNSTSSTETATACNSYTWACNGMTYTASGMYTCTSLNAAGCVHTTTLDLVITTGTTTTSSATACDTYTWAVNGMTYTTSGMYTHTTSTGNGCVSTEILNLTINYSTANTSSASACDEYMWTVNGMTYTTSGTYVHTSLNAAGCTHTETLNLTVGYSSASSMTQFACDTYTWPENGMTYTTSGTYTSTSLNATGCVHTSTLVLTVNYNSTTSETVTACDSYTWNGTTYTMTGVYTYTTINGSTPPPTYCAAGATTTCINGDEFIGNVTIGAINNTTICGTTYNDHTSLSTNVTPGNSYAISVGNPNSFTGDQVTVWADWNQNGLFTDAGETTTLVYGAGIATGSIAVPLGATVGATRMRVRLNYTGTMLPCGNTFYGEVEDYTLVVDGPSTAGCVNTATLNLTINNSTTSTETMTACDSYTWPCDNVTYTASGVYTCTSLNAAGCVNTATLTLTINNSTSSSESQFACDSYTWNGTTYTTSGTYTYTSLNAVGCTHTATLSLLVNYSTFNGDATVTACDTYTWNGMTYTMSGVYTYTSTNAVVLPAYCAAGANINCANGDEFIENVTIGSINNTTVCGTTTYEDYTSMSTAVTAGSSYPISVTNGNDFSGDQITVWADWNQNGTFEATEATIVPYVYGGTTGASNTSTGSIAVPANAVNGNTRMRVRLNFSGAMSPCGNTSFGEVEDYTLTVSGGVAAPAGCVNTATLTLTINASTSTSTTTTQCNAYTWNGNTYTTSGVYVYTSLNAAGCTNSDTLNLTINYGSTSTENVTACNSYTWVANGMTYTAAGTYTHTLLNSAGCDSLLTLNLILNNGVHVAPKVFLYGAYVAADGMMNDILRSSTTLGDPLGAIPVPYLIPPHIPSTPTHFLPSMGATIGAGVLAVSGANAITDWVYVEVRDGANNNTVVSSQHALVQRDGDVVSTDGVTDLYFPTVCPGDYYVSVKHRNHLGVMSPAVVALSAAPASVDFTTGTVWAKPGVTNPARVLVNPGVYALWGGDALNNKNTKYNGSANDKEAILNAVLGAVPPGYPYPPSNNTTYGYRNEDVNMDGMVRYNNANNDKNWMLSLILSSSPTSTPNDILSQHTPN